MRETPKNKNIKWEVDDMQGKEKEEDAMKAVKKPWSYKQ